MLDGRVTNKFRSLSTNLEKERSFPNMIFGDII